jgi:signal peptidase
MDMMITHRVIGIGEGAYLHFITRGDANDKPDPFIVPASNVVGRVWFCLPLLGRFVRFLDSTAGYITCLILPAVVIIGLYVWRLLAASGNKETTP